MFRTLKLKWYLSQLNSRDRPSRIAAVSALGNLGDQRAVEPLLDVLGSAVVDGPIVVLVAEALGKLADRRAVGPLIVAQGDADWAVRWAAACALLKLGEPIWQGLLLEGSYTAVWALRENRRSELDRVKADHCHRLGSTGDLRAVDALIRALDEGVVGLAASAALAKLGEPKWRSMIGGTHGVFETLAGCDDPRAIEPLIQALSDERASVRRAAAKG